MRYSVFILLTLSLLLNIHTSHAASDTSHPNQEGYKSLVRLAHEALTSPSSPSSLDKWRELNGMLQEPVSMVAFADATQRPIMKSIARLNIFYWNTHPPRPENNPLASPLDLQLTSHLSALKAIEALDGFYNVGSSAYQAERNQIQQAFETLFQSSTPSSPKVVETDAEVLAERLMTGDMNEGERRYIIEVLAKIPLTDRASVAELALPLMTEGMSKRDRASVIVALADIPSSDRVSVGKWSRQLMTESMNGYDRAKIIKYLTYAPSKKLASVVELSLSLMTKNMDADNRLIIIRFFLRAPSVNQASVAKLALPLMTEGMNGRDRAKIIETLANIPSADRASVVRWFRSFITEDMSGDDQASIICALARVPSSDRASVAKLALPFITEGMDGIDRAHITLSLARVSSTNRASVVELAPQLIPEGMGRDRAEIIAALAKVPSADRVSVAESALPLMTEDMSGPNRARIITRLATLPTDERAARAIRARANMDLPADHERFTNRLIQLLETPLDQPIPPLDGGMAAAAVHGGYAYGINVHDGERDGKTGQAIQLLKKYQEGLMVKGEMTKADIDLSYKALIQTIHMLPEENKKTHIMQTLGLPGAPSCTGFGGFLSGHVSSYGLNNMKPQEFLGRLWYFATHLEDVKDQENAKTSLLSALENGVEDDGHVVCNPGKIQRMIIGVLQGRLKGVNIDGVEIKEEKKEPSAAVTLTKTDQKKADDLMKAQAMTSSINKGSVIRELEKEGTLTKDQQKAYEAYIDERMKAIGAILTSPILREEYLNRDSLDKAKKSYLEANPEVDQDALLKDILIHHMDMKFQEDIKTLFSEFEDLKENRSLSLNKEEGKELFRASALNYLSKYPEVDREEFMKLVGEKLGVKAPSALTLLILKTFLKDL